VRDDPEFDLGQSLLLFVGPTSGIRGHRCNEMPCGRAKEGAAHVALLVGVIGSLYDDLPHSISRGARSHAER
jgi:hypothetical protein